MTGNIQIDQLVRSLLQKDSLEQCSLLELEQFAGRHPYFGAAQLLLAKKMQVENAAGYNEQLQKTYLFFNNPMWVHKLLGETGEVMVEQSQEVPMTEEIPMAAGTVTEEIPKDHIRESEINEPGDTETTFETETLAETELKQPVEVVPAEAEAQPVPAEMKAQPIPAPVNPAKKEETAVTDVLTFEPYHTVDYFASQGIRYKPEERPTDKFGQQLKSFTDWLKVMKRLPMTEIEAKSEPAAEKKVEQLAERSLVEKDVVTEAMAEIWVKQGNPQKAVAIYRKLSLLDPSKTAYFAAKIEDLQK